jgi:hypothetical protein
VVVALSLLVTGCGTKVKPVGEATDAPTLALTTEIPPGGTGEAGSFYYYADGERIQLTPSREWLSVQFASDDPAKRAEALKVFDSLLGPVDQAREIPNSQISLVPLKPGLSLQDLLRGINLMRADQESFLNVSPVFQSGQVTLILTDRFIASFPAGMSQEEIKAISTKHHAEIVEPILGQNNTFILRRLPASKLDTLGLSNLYQESGIAIHAAPDFLRLTQR